MISYADCELSKLFRVTIVQNIHLFAPDSDIVLSLSLLDVSCFINIYLLTGMLLIQVEVM